MKYVGDRIVFPERQEDGSGYRISIPGYHRAAVGLFPGTKLFLLPIPRTHDLIVTSISPSGWGDLWRLEVVLSDIPGAARSIVNSLVKNHVNILVEEGLSDYGADGRIAHHLFLILDLVDYKSDIDGNTHHRNSVEKPGVKPNQLITAILSDALSYLHTTPAEDAWDFTFERMEFFFRHKEHRTNAKPAHLLSEARSILIPDQLIQQTLFDGKTPSRLACHILSDTEDKYMKLRFLPGDSRCLLLRIAHKEKIGAILSFMNILKKVRVNIANSYSRLSTMSKNAIWYAFLEFPPGFQETELSTMLQDIDDLEEVEGFTIRSHHGFKHNPHDHAKGLGLTRYSERHHAQKAKVRILPRVPNNVDRPKIEQILDLKPYYIDQDWKREAQTVFVAMPFDRKYLEFYKDHIKETIESCGLRAVRIDQQSLADPRITLPEWICKYIATCDFVVADVTGSSGNVLYEVGLAHAIGKRVLLICEEQDGIGDKLLFDIRNFKHVFYSPYRISTFDANLRANVVAMRDYAE